MSRRLAAALVASLSLALALPLAAQHMHGTDAAAPSTGATQPPQGGGAGMSGHEHGAGMGSTDDKRIAVALPEPMRMHILANMRDHLASLQQIQAALAGGKFDLAAEIAEHHLGMTSLKMHGASDLAPHMPAAMQAIGTEMHHEASRFAVEATNASASGDVRAPLGALARVMAQCVACHGAYRVK